MPHGIFHVVAVHRLVTFELLVPFFKFVGVIIADTALPMVRILPGHVLQISIKVGNRFLNLGGLEIRLTAFLMQIGNNGRRRFERQRLGVGGDGFIVLAQGIVELALEEM